MRQIVNVIIGSVVVLLPHFLSAQKLSLSYLDKTELRESDYFSGSLPFQTIGKQVYYSTKKGSIVSFYKTGETADSLILTLETFPNEYYKSFRFSDDLSKLYILMHGSIIKLEMNETPPVALVNSTQAKAIYQLNETYDEITVNGNNLIVTQAYNEAVDLLSEPSCRYLILDASDLKEVSKQKMPHDALGLSHKHTYFFDVQYGKILFVNALKNTFSVVEIDENKTTYFGDSTLLNSGIDKIPFDTKVLKYSNPKDMVLKTIKFANSINYFEGGKFINDSTIMIVEKLKGRNPSKRKLHFYQYSKQQNQWTFLCFRTFKNRKASSRYHIFQFYYPNPLQIVDNRVYLAEISATGFSKRKINKDIENTEEIKFALYEYKLEL